MSNIVFDPPIKVPITEIEIIRDFDKSLHIYLSYDYLPSRNFYLFLKNVNELYENVFKILYNANPSSSEKLIIDEIRTGNSIDVLLQLADKLNPSPKAWIAISIATSLLMLPAQYQAYIERKTKIELSEKNIKKTEAETEKILVDVELGKVQIDKQKIENQLLRDSLNKKHIEEKYLKKIREPENQKKLNKKVRSANKQISSPPMNKSLINNYIIYNNVTKESNQNMEE